MSFIYRRVAPVLFPSITWHTHGPMVHLTFDDGPHPAATPLVLEILRHRKIRATFFVLGNNVERHPDLTNQICEEGHSVGIHGLTHRSMIFRSFVWQQDQIVRAKTVVRQTIGKETRLFRPPYGRFNRTTLDLATRNSLRTVLWDVDSKDYNTDAPQSIVRRVCRETQPGSIVLFHDNDSTAAHIREYLNPILDAIQQRNLQLSPL
jgi:peptidoglycan/xylan/chitin deacetylase (PgdA/CDA1 family)